MLEQGKWTEGRGELTMKQIIDFATYPVGLPLLGSPLEFIPTSLHVVVGLASPSGLPGIVVGFAALRLGSLGRHWVRWLTMSSQGT